MRERPNGAGLSRKAILSEIDHSLKRLETDYVDLYIPWSAISKFGSGNPIRLASQCRGYALAASS